MSETTYHNPQPHAMYGVLRKKWMTALMLSIFLGWLGIDRFYLGHTGVGIAKFMTLGLLGFWSFIDIIMIATKNVKGVEWVD